MKAIIFERYGSTDVLKIAEVEKPVPSDHQVLIKVRAAAVNPADYLWISGTIRFLTGMFKPKLNRLGYDVAGRVEEVGSKVTQFKPGDEVFGACVRDPHKNGQSVWLYEIGAFAEYTLVHEAALALKPQNLTFEQAASIPCAAWTALQGLRFGGIRPGAKVLISSATGGIGTFAVQLAKMFGAEVTAVCSTKNMDLVRSLGADLVVDYTTENYTQLGRRYDLIFDSIGDQPLLALSRALSAGGKVVVVSIRNTGFPGMMARWCKAVILSSFSAGKFVGGASRPNKQDLAFLSECVSAGKIKPVINKQYSGLVEVPKAVQEVKEGRAWGKVVVTVQS